jgi:hypothetical protein
LISLSRATVTVGRGNGTGYFRPVYFFPVGVGLVAADLDGNGTPDLAVTGFGRVVVLPNKP